VGQPRFGFVTLAGSLLHGLVDHAARRNPERRGARARKDGRSPRPGRSAKLMKARPSRTTRTTRGKEPLFDAADTLRDTL